MDDMKRAIVLAVILSLSQALTALAGPEVSSKEVVPPPAPPPPPEYFRPNEFDIGAFGSYAEGVGSGGHHLHGWGGGMDFTYWFPWKYAGVRFQGSKCQWRWRFTNQRSYACSRLRPC